MKKLTIGVIGHAGMVGSEVFNYYKEKRYPTLGLSSRIHEGYPNSTWEEINKYCDVVFVCVPTPFSFSTEKSNFEIVREVVSKISPGKIVVLKSTVWPGFTDKLQDKYPKLSILFNPEFLSRSSSKEDFRYPDRQLVGYTPKSKKAAQKILDLLPKSPYSKTTKAKEAELIKYAHNVWGATRVMWANHLYEVSQRLGIQYEVVRDGFAASKFIGPGMLRYMTIFHNDKRGYGGPCFPKDVASYLEFSKKIKVNAELPQATRKMNKRILKEQGLTENKAERY